MLADSDIELQVRDKLTATRRDFGKLAVLVKDGQVRLTGPVPSYHLRQMAIEGTRHVPGVQTKCR